MYILRGMIPILIYGHILSIVIKGNIAVYKVLLLGYYKMKRSRELRQRMQLCTVPHVHK